jgi:hypothetical protein
MKQVFNTNEVAHIWANQKQDAGRNANNNLYFKHQTIYSYGSHFPIATIDGDKVLFTLRTYSNTTAKHISKVRQAVSHKEFIYCAYPPTSCNGEIYEEDRTKNFNYWKGNIKSLLSEIGNPKNRKLDNRVISLQKNVFELENYCTYFKIKNIGDVELLGLLKLCKSENIVNAAKEAKAVTDKAIQNKMKLATKAFDVYLKHWRNFDNEALKAMPDKIKDLCSYYDIHGNGFTRLRLNKSNNRLETSKGIEIPVLIALKAYTALKDCLKGNCKGLNIPVVGYTITEANTKFIKAGCHTIPQIDILYIAGLCGWN